MSKSIRFNFFRTARHSIGAILLAVALVVGIPMTAMAEEGDSAPQAVELTKPLERRITTAPDDGSTPDELLDAYVEQLFNAELPGAEGPQRAARWTRLSGATLRAYKLIAPRIQQIAAEGGSTKLLFPADQVCGTSSYTVDDLYQTFDDIDTGTLLDALLCDFPSELYWFDKTVGLGLTLGYDDDGTTIVFGFELAVWQDYAADDGWEQVEDDAGNLHSVCYKVDATKVTSASSAVQTAKGIVAAHAGEGTYQRLCSFRDEICDLTSYNHDAAGGSVAYGDPWQLVWVFDGNKSTNVVCEGYSKAFQYLCDLSFPRNDAGTASVESHLVTGHMDGGTGAGAHMWNIVAMPDGKNYMVDVTNSDSGTVGSSSFDYPLFLAGTSGSVSAGYTFAAGGGSIAYTYDNEMLSIYTADELTLATTNYVPGDEPDNPDNPDVPGPTSISDATATFASQTFTGVALTPEATVTLADGTVLADEDFELDAESSANLVNAGSYQVKVVGKGDYTGTATGTFTINPCKVTFTSDGATKTYDGTALINGSIVMTSSSLQVGPEVTFKVSGSQTDVGSSENAFTYQFAAGVIANNYQVTVVFGTLTVTPASIADAIVTFEPQTYTGKALTPIATVGLPNGTMLGEGDFALDAVSSANLVEVGTHDVTVVGKGNYEGTATGTFEILAAAQPEDPPVNPASITEADVTLSSTEYLYNGTVQKPTVTSVTLGGKELSSADYTVAYSAASSTNAGDYTVTVTGKGNYTGTARGSYTVRFTIKPASIANATVTLSNTAFTYDGTVQKPTVSSVTLGNKELSAADYTVSYSSASSTNAGSYTVTVTGKGNYTGTARATYVVKPASIAGAVVALSDTEYLYNGTVQKPTVASVTLGNKELSAADYTVAYSAATSANAGDYTVTTTGKGNYTGTARATYKINPASISGAALTLAKATTTYNKSAQKPVVTRAGGKALVAGTDYTLTCLRNGKTTTDYKSAGTITVKVVGKGNYTGTSATATYKIVAKKVTPAVTLAKASTTYNAKAQKPVVKAVKADATTLTSAGYTVIYLRGSKATKDFTTAGTITVKVTLKGNYSGSKSVSYKITKAANPMVAKVANRTASVKTLKSKAVTVARPIAISRQQGKLSYAKVSGSGAFTVNKTTGNVTVGKGTKAGTYAIKIKVVCAGNTNYNSVTKTFTCKVIVK